MPFTISKILGSYKNGDAAVSKNTDADNFFISGIRA